MPRYESAEFDPPAPVVRAMVQGATGVALEVPLLLDTGADGTVIPRTAALAVGANLRPTTATPLGYAGDRKECEQADFTVQFQRITIRGQFLVAETDVGVLGRNVLNNLVLSLNGPDLLWEIVSTGGGERRSRS